MFFKLMVVVLQDEHSEKLYRSIVARFLSNVSYFILHQIQLDVHIKYSLIIHRSIIVLSLFQVDIMWILSLLFVFCNIVRGNDIGFKSVYLDARCLATCSTEVTYNI